MKASEPVYAAERVRCHACRVVLPAAMIASALAAVMLGQDINWDLRNYHFNLRMVGNASVS